MISQKRSFVGPVGRAFVHERRRAGGQRTIDDVAVPGDPADVGGAPVDVFVADVEDPLDGLLGEQVVAGRGVHDALRLAGRAAGVEDEERVFAVERLGGAVGRGLGHQLVPPEVAAFLHCHVACRCAGRRRTVLTVGDFSKRFIDVLLQRQSACRAASRRRP